MAEEESSIRIEMKPRVISDFSTSQASEKEETRTEKVGSADAQVHESVKRKADHSHFDEITRDGFRVTRDQTVEAVRVTRETSLTDSQLQHLLGSSTSGDVFEGMTSLRDKLDVERNIEVTEVKTTTKMASTSSAPTTPHDTTMPTFTEDTSAMNGDVSNEEEEETEKANDVIVVESVESEPNDTVNSDDASLSVDTGVEVYEAEVVRSERLPVEKHLPLPGEADTSTGESGSESKKSSRQKELVIDNTTQLVENEKRKMKSSASFSGGFKGLFRRKDKSNEEVQKEKEAKAKEKKEEKERKHREKEERERLKREKKNAKKSSLKKKRKPTGSEHHDDTKSDVTSEHTTPRNQRAADVTTSLSTSSQGLNESRDDEDGRATPVTSTPRTETPNERAVDVGDDSFQDEHIAFPVEV